MADDVEMIPVDAAEPPKANPLAAPVAPKLAGSAAQNPAPAAPAGVLKPGLKLPPKPGATLAMKPGLKLPPKPGALGAASGLKLPPKPGALGANSGLKLPPKPGATLAMKPGLKLPPKPGVPAAGVAAGLKLPTQPALKPGVRLPPKPVIRKPGATVVAAPLPKPVTPLAKPAAPAAAATPVATAAPAAPAAPEVKPAAEVKPVAVDAQGVGKLPTVTAQAIARDDTAPTVTPNPNAMEALKSVTQKLKGITQEIPQQAILRKTGIIAEGAMSESQKEAAKHKTARISLSDAMGVAPVKNENSPMKTIRIKRPEDIGGALKPQIPSGASPAVAPAAVPPPSEAAEAPAPAAPATASVTQRKTIKVARPGGSVRPAGKFGIKRPAVAAPKPPAPSAAPAAAAPAGEAPLPDIADIPDLPPPAPVAAAPVANDGPAWLVSLSAMLQLAACVVMGTLAWFLYQNVQTAYF